MRERRRAQIFAVFLVVAALLGQATLMGEEKVAFNVETKKYHCLSCKWAIKCTKSCVEINVREAKKRGGIPCKVCEGGCG